ncbi:MAG: hypothetical protein JWO12_2282 [Frankiales bacterium]|nr:hypothetical protein [Frankiales bacterium]
MSALLGVLQLTGKGGNELYVFDDALVRAATGLSAALLGALDGARNAEALMKAVSGDSLSDKGPEEIAAQSHGNRLIWLRNVQGAALTRGRWYSPGRRTLALTAVNGEEITFGWPGDGATRPLNHDAYVVAVLERALGDRLDNRLAS